jgi:hypothetical protein
VDLVDEVIVLTGFRPNLSFLSEIRLGLDERLQAPTALAPLIDPNVHSCGTVYPHGVNEVSHPEKGVYLAGMKSYSRAPTFLAMTGYEQTRSLGAALAGDQEAAERVELTLPETGDSHHRGRHRQLRQEAIADANLHQRPCSNRSRKRTSPTHRPLTSRHVAGWRADWGPLPRPAC